MNALMGLLSDLVAAAVADLGLPSAEQSRTLRAYQKLFWIQNDFISRQYCGAPPPAE
ncbi:MAG: hypothetical protein FJX77_09125 [Armatimonadetes bacterium]|nr:hypothetical protein [Armatimonadota bacterium]